MSCNICAVHSQCFWFIYCQCLYCSPESIILHRKHCQFALVSSHLVLVYLRDMKCHACACSVQTAPQVQQGFQASLHRIYRENTRSASFTSLDRENSFLVFLANARAFSFSSLSFFLAFCSGVRLIVIVDIG